MAYIIPSDTSRLALSGAHSPKIQTLDLLFIKQKNGLLGENGLSKGYLDDTKNPVDQIHGPIDKGREKFQWQYGKKRPLQVDVLTTRIR